MDILIAFGVILGVSLAYGFITAAVKDLYRHLSTRRHNGQK